MQSSQVVASPIPRELLRCPRTALRKPGTFGFLLLGRILTAPLVAVAIVLLAFAVLEPILVFVLPAQSAKIIAQWPQQNSHHGIEYYIEYQFDRSGFIGRDQVLMGEFQAMAVGQEVKAHVIHFGEVGYSALDRSLRSYSRYRGILWFGTLFSVAIGWILFQAVWYAPWRTHWLVRYGKATFGAVVSKSILHGGRRHMHFTLTYQFRAMGTLQARRIRITPQRYDAADLKDLVIILFDPARPRRSIVYDYCDFIAA
jgi:hypothetical protein